ncbi:MAG: hypothetical protein RIS75_1453 [Actinomycetota bacterium]|jgi:hypothetical protein
MSSLETKRLGFLQIAFSLYLVGMFLFLFFGSFRFAALYIAAGLAGVLIWRITSTADTHAWFSVRRRWIDITTLSFFLIFVTIFALWVPSPR